MTEFKIKVERFVYESGDVTTVEVWSDILKYWLPYNESLDEYIEVINEIFDHPDALEKYPPGIYTLHTKEEK